MADSDPPAPSQLPTATTATPAPAPAPASTAKDEQKEADEASSVPTAADKEAGPAPKISGDADDDDVNPPDFQGSVLSNDDLPSPETIRRIGEYTVLDRYGKSHTFKSLYTGRSVARRVLVIFVRHFYCGVSPARCVGPSCICAKQCGKVGARDPERADMHPPLRTARSTCAPSPPRSRPTLSSTCQ